MFEPINEAHAVAEMLVFLQFSPNLSPALPSLMGLKDLLEAKLPTGDGEHRIQYYVGRRPK